MVRVRRVRVGRDSTVRDRVQIRVSSSSKILQWDKFCNASNYAPHQHKGSNRLLSRVWWHTKWDKDSLCHDIRKSHITRLQQIHNSPACAVKSSHNNTTILCSFCWLKITEHTEYKLLSHTKSSQPRNVVTSRMTSCDLTHDLMWPHAWPHVTSRMTSCDLTHDLMWPHAWPHVTSRMTSSLFNLLFICCHRHQRHPPHEWLIVSFDTLQCLEPAPCFSAHPSLCISISPLHTPVTSSSSTVSHSLHPRLLRSFTANLKPTCFTTVSHCRLSFLPHDWLHGLSHTTDSMHYHLDFFFWDISVFVF